MSPHSQQLPSPPTFPAEILGMIVEEIETPKTLLSLSCTCSTVNAIVTKNPLWLYARDIRFQRRRISDPEFRKRRPAALPGLIHAIQHEDLSTFKTVLQLYQEGLSQDFIGTWPTDESGRLLSPTPIEAAITAHRYDIFQVLVRAGCELQLGDKLNKVLDHIRGLHFGEPTDRWTQTFLERALLGGLYMGLLNTHVESREYGSQTAGRFLYQMLGTVAFGDH